jgi:hypothetical protein
MGSAGHRVEAAGRPRVATQDASRPEDQASPGAETPDGLDGIARTARLVAATRRQQRRDQHPIHADGPNEDACGNGSHPLAPDSVGEPCER